MLRFPVIPLHVHIYPSVYPSQKFSANPSIFLIFLDHSTETILTLTPINFHVESLAYNLLDPL